MGEADTTARIERLENLVGSSRNGGRSAGVTQVLVREAASPYAVQPFDQILVDNSVGGTTVTLKLPASPGFAEQHTVKWWKSQGSPVNGPVIDGNGNSIEDWAAGAGFGSLGATTTITSIGGQSTWAWFGAPVRAWVQVG